MPTVSTTAKRSKEETASTIAPSSSLVDPLVDPLHAPVQLTGGGQAAETETAKRKRRAAENVQIQGGAEFDCVGPQHIIDPDSSAETCHEYALGRQVYTAQDARAAWMKVSETKEIVLCFQGTEVAHSAVKRGNRCLQTLPGCPTFWTSLADLQKAYGTVLDLSDPIHQAKLNKMAQNETAASAKAAMKAKK
jgi:hypothetical protein